MIPGSKGLKPPVLAQRSFLKNGRIWFNDSPAFLIYLSFLSLCFCVFPIDSTAVFWQQDNHLHSDNTDIDNADLSSDGCNHPHPYSYHRDNTHIPRHKYNKCMFHSWFLTLYSIFSLHFPPVARTCSIAFCCCSFYVQLATLFLVSYHVFIDCVHFSV